ncbi:unnamed protein product, partial [Prorocentrum cordatum]
SSSAQVRHLIPPAHGPTPRRHFASRPRFTRVVTLQMRRQTVSLDTWFRYYGLLPPREHLLLRLHGLCWRSGDPLHPPFRAPPPEKGPSAPADATWATTGDFTTEVFVAGFALTGLPIIVLAVWGLWNKREVLLRLYFGYFFLTILRLGPPNGGGPAAVEQPPTTVRCAHVSSLSAGWDMSFEVEEFLLEGMNCNTMPSVLMQIGKSWACGALRITDCVVVLGSLALQAYLLYNVWSHCEDLSEAGGGLLGDLMVGEAALARKKKMEDPYEAFLDHTGDVPEGYGAVPATKGGSQQIFGGKLHEMRFPPPPPSARAWGR